MKWLALVVVSVVLGAGVVAPTAAAEQLQAQPVSMSPNDDPQPGEPVSIVFRLHTLGLSPHPADGRPAAGVDDVEVVLRGNSETRRFPAEDLGGGRYRTEIVFPGPGGWHLRVGYRAGHHGAGGEIQLGKGAIYVAACCVGPQPGESTSAESSGRPWTTIALVATVLAVALAAAAFTRFGAIGHRRRTAPTA